MQPIGGSSSTNVAVWRAENYCVSTNTSFVNLTTGTTFVTSPVELSKCNYHGIPIDCWFVFTFIYVGIAVLAGRHLRA